MSAGPGPRRHGPRRVRRDSLGYRGARVADSARRVPRTTPPKPTTEGLRISPRAPDDGPRPVPRERVRAAGMRAPAADPIRAGRALILLRHLLPRVRGRRPFGISCSSFHISYYTRREYPDL